MIMLNQTQAKLFAQEIFEDIDGYIEFHKEEFEAFLQEESNEIGGNNNE